MYNKKHGCITYLRDKKHVILLLLFMHKSYVYNYNNFLMAFFASEILIFQGFF